MCYINLLHFQNANKYGYIYCEIKPNAIKKDTEIKF